MNKRITSLLLSVVMICSMLVTAVPAWAAPGDSGVTASVTQAAPGDTFSVTLKVPGTEKPISDLSLKVRFDNTVFEVTEYTIPDIEGMSNMQSNVEEANRNAFFSATYGSITYEADVPFNEGLELTAYFKVKEDAPLGDSVFKLDESVSVGSLTDMGLPDILVPYEDFVNKTATIKVVGAPKPATGITLDKTSLALTVGDVETLVATVTPADTTDKVTWASGDDSVATVDAAGKVTAVGVGETTITAKAGSVSATCAVKVEAAPCTHANKTTVPEKASNCTDRGWDAYQICDDCGALFDSTGNPIAEIPYRALNDDHDFDTTTWGYKGADGHAHVCTRNPDHHDAVVPHTSSGPATEDTAETCTVCGYVITPATGHVCASHLTKVEAEAATCTDPGNLEHYKCSCGKLYADGTASVELSEEDVVIDALGHDWAEEWSSDETNHWHACTRCDATTDLHAHNPDHEGGATVDYPILCTDCGYVMEEQLVEGTIRVELPFRLTVQQLDEMAPGAQTFRFLVFGFGAPVDYEIITDTVDTDGAKTYQGTFTFTIPEQQWGNLSEGFSFLQVVGDAEGWTYDPVVYYAMPEFRGNDGGVSAWTFYEVTPDGWPDYDSPVEEMVFVNGYAAKKPVEPTPSPKPSEPPKPSEAPKPTQTLKPVQPPQTGDHSHLILWVSLLLVSGAVGMALVSQKRRRNQK